MVSDGKYHVSNILDLLILVYQTGTACVDFKAIYRIHTHEAFFVTRSKSNMSYQTIDKNFNIHTPTGLRSDKIIVLNGYKSKKLYPEPLRLVEYYDKKNDEILLFLTNKYRGIYT